MWSYVQATKIYIQNKIRIIIEQKIQKRFEPQSTLEGVDNAYISIICLSLSL